MSISSQKLEEYLATNTSPELVAMALNKRLFYQNCGNEVRTPPYALTDEGALALFRPGHVDRVVSHYDVHSRDGKGIKVYKNSEELLKYVGGLLYTKYIPKSEEYRVHIFKGDVILLEAKRRYTKYGRWPPLVCVTHNGYYFTSGKVKPPEDVITQARLAMAVVGLSYGAVDVMWNNYQNRAYVIELYYPPTGSEVPNKTPKHGWVESAKAMAAPVPVYYDIETNESINLTSLQGSMPQPSFITPPTGQADINPYHYITAGEWAKTIQWGQ